MSNDEYQHQNSFKTEKEIPLGMGFAGILKEHEISTYTPLTIETLKEFMEAMEKFYKHEQNL